MIDRTGLYKEYQVIGILYPTKDLDHKIIEDLWGEGWTEKEAEEIRKRMKERYLDPNFKSIGRYGKKKQELCF